MRSLDSRDNAGHINSVILPPKKLKLQEDGSLTADVTEMETLRVDTNCISCNESNCEGDDVECCSIYDKAFADGQQRLFCESCSIWYHISCCGVNETVYQELNGNEDHGFRCPNCVIVSDMILNEERQGTVVLNSHQIEKKACVGTRDVIVLSQEFD